MTAEPRVPTDLTGFADEPLTRLRGLLDVSTKASDDERLRLTALLVDRVIDVLRGGSRKDAIDDALALESFLASAGGTSLDTAAPRTFGEWKALARVLARAGRRFDRLSVDSVRRGQPTYGDAVLRELHVAPNGSLQRKDLRERVAGISDSQLSHLLRDFEAVGLVLRLPDPARRSVVVELGPVGRDVARKEFGEICEPSDATDAADRFVRETDAAVPSFAYLPQGRPVASFAGYDDTP